MNFIGIKEDITEQKSLKNSLEKMNSELKNTAAKLIEDKEQLMILNEKLSKSQKELKESLAIKNKIFSIISHDIRNPLQVLIMSSELADRYYKNNDYQKLQNSIKRLVDTSMNLSDFIENLLLWGSTQTNQFQFSPELFNFSIFLESILLITKQAADKKQIELEVNNKIDYVIYADPSLLKNIILNLLFNAIKFTNKNGKVIINTSENNDNYIIQIKDTGVGMSSEEVVKLFKINFTKKGTKGESCSGLGLMIVKEFVNLRNGEITAKSVKEYGTTFTVTIPKKRSLKNKINN